MQIYFENKDLLELLKNKKPPKGIPPDVLKSYQKTIEIIKAAKDQRDIRAYKSFHLEKMKEFPDGRHSIRLTGKWRLFILFENVKNENCVVVISMNNHYGD